MKKITINKSMRYYILFVLMLVPVWLKPSDSLLLRLPVHIAADPEGARLNPLQKNVLMLFINGSQREIERLQTRTWNINKTSDLSRHFVLSFHMDGFDRKIMEGVGYFIDNILDRSDSLTVLTPIRSYQLKLDKGKAAVYDAVEQLLEKDGLDYRNKRAALIGRVEKEITSITRLFGKDAYFYFPHPVFFNFFSFCQQTIADIKLHFLAPFVLQERVVKELPQKGEGETWWLHFQHRAFEPIPSALRNIIDRLVTLQNAGMIRNAKSYEFAQLLKQMTISSQFPLLPLQEKLQQENICYNVIFWGALDNRNPDLPHLPSTELESSLAQITRGSGGTIVKATLPSQGLIKLQQHENRFYEVVFPFNEPEPGEPVEIRLILADQRQKRTIQLNYPHFFEKEKIQALVKEFSREKVKIIDLSLEGNQLSFAVTDFHANAPDIVGLVKVRAELYKEQQVYTPVFSTGNTLHAASKTIQISLPLPSTYSGQFRLRVSVCDLITNQLDMVERRIRLR